MPEEEEKSTIKFSGTDRKLLGDLISKIGRLAHAIENLTKRIDDMKKD